MSAPRQRLGLFGGSFDPVHCGHLLVAEAACEELALDRLVFIPAAQSPFKPQRTPAPAKERLRLLRLALAGRTRYEVDTQEIRRGGTSFTIDTIRDYRSRFPEAELFYLIGADHVPTLPSWRDAEILAQWIEFAVIARPGERGAPVPPPFRGRELAGFPLGVSSSDIRTRVKAGLSVQGLVPEAVAEAIANSKLYL
jgi:nicotinate-nucleotide adenylyltransferase